MAESVTGVVTGFVLRATGHPTVYVSGDNASVDIVGEIASIGRIDIAVLHVGAANPGRFGDTDVTTNARTAPQAAELLGEAVIVPFMLGLGAFQRNPRSVGTDLRLWRAARASAGTGEGPRETHCWVRKWSGDRS